MAHDALGASTAPYVLRESALRDYFRSAQAQETRIGRHLDHALQVRGCRAQERWIVSEETKAAIVISTEHAPDSTGLMVVVHVGGRRRTDETATALFGQ